MKLRVLESTLVLGALVLVALGTAACGASPTSPDVPLTIEDIQIGDGAPAEVGKNVTVNYTGWLYDVSKADHKGVIFDTNAGKDPIIFTLGQGQVIPGWDQGVQGMKVHGTRRLIIPPSFAYGPSRSGAIPPNATLIFEIELLDVQDVVTAGRVR